MIKTLPLISSDYELFDWQTDEDTKKAYDALINKGQTGEFGYVVWNDIINKLSGAMDEAGLAWDAQYGGVNETKMSYFDIFTAKRFNAVTYNIEKLINNKWKWDVVPDVTGFLGRARVKGYTEAGKNADVVYGWYLIELARVVNLFIDILKNEADFAELIYKESIETSLNDGIRGGDAERLEYAESIETSLDDEIRAGDSQPLASESISSSNESAEMVAGDGMQIEADSISETTNDTRMISADGGLIQTAVNSFTEQIAKLNVFVAGVMKSTNNKQETTLDGGILAGDGASFGNSDIAETILDSEMNTGDGQKTDADGIQKSIVDAEMIAVIPIYTGAEDTSHSNASLEMISISPSLIDTDSVSESLVSAEASLKESARAEIDGESKTITTTDLYGGIAELIGSLLMSNFTVSAVLSFYEEILSWIDPEWTSETNLYIRQAYSAVQSGTNLKID